MMRINVCLCLLGTALFARPAFSQNNPPPAAPAAGKPAPQAEKAAEEKKAEPLCPVTHQKIDRRYSTAFQGRKVYFASQDAFDSFKKDPQKYLDGVHAQWEAMPQYRTQVRCPVTGKPIDRQQWVEQGDDVVFFATPEAKEEFTKEPAKFVKKLDSDCYTFQTHCLVCKEEINPTLTIDLGGRTVFLGCEGCRSTLSGDKEKYEKAFDDQTKANRAAYTRQVTEMKLERLKAMRNSGEKKGAGPGDKPAGQPGNAPASQPEKKPEKP